MKINSILVPGIVHYLENLLQNFDMLNFDLLFHLQDEGQPSLSTTITITVNVTNDEESACVFGQKFYYSSIPEGYYASMVRH